MVILFLSSNQYKEVKCVSAELESFVDIPQFGLGKVLQLLIGDEHQMPMVLFQHVSGQGSVWEVCWVFWL